MAETRKGAPDRQFAIAIFPLIIGALAALGYGITLNHWVSLQSLPMVSRVCGWDWQGQTQRPLAFVVLYPFRFLPPAEIPLALNIFTAVCAALVLALLARSVALWPQDRTRPQWWREKSEFATLSTPTAWMPPLAAVLACGLQLTFWEHATSASGEMLDLLIFAWAIRALCEFRISEKQKWLSSVAFFFAAGMADNWTLIAYLPALVAALIWLKGFGFFEARFLGRMCLWGALGLCFYLVLPLAHSLSSVEHVGFWAGLKAYLKMQKDSWRYFPKGTLSALAFTAGVPLLAISICWRGRSPNFGDDSLVGSVLSKAVFHFVHAVFLLVSLWLMLDSPFSPRKIGYGLPFLTQYYISSLVIGYCIGYFILVGTVDVPKYVAIPTLALLGIFLCLIPGALIWRNRAQVRTTNGPILRDFARELCGGLPNGNSVVLSDDPALLLLTRSEMASRRSQAAPLFLDARALMFVPYLRYLTSEYKTQWPFSAPTNGAMVIEPGAASDMIVRLLGEEPGIYLNSSFSYCMERLRAEPHRAVERVFPRGAPGPPRLDAEGLANNERFWQKLWTNSLVALAQNPTVRPVAGSGFADQLARWLRLDPEQNATVAFVNGAYSKASDAWGVYLQRSGDWNLSSVWFQRAVDLKPENLSARINLGFNELHRRNAAQPLDRESVQRDLLNLFTLHRNWESAVAANGPVDEPTFTFETAKVLLAHGSRRQAAIEFARCSGLAPNWIEPRLWHAQTLLNERDYEGAARATERIQPVNLPSDGSSQAQYLFCRATALQGLNQTNEAAQCITEFVAKHPEQEEVLSIAARLYLRQMDYQPALGVFDQLLKHQPGRLEYLSNKGLAEIQLGQYEEAVSTLTGALAESPGNQVVRLNRAIANLRAGRLEPAWSDYQELLNGSPDSTKVLFGLGEISWRKHDTNAAIGFYEKYLTNGLPDPADKKLASQRLRELKGAQKN